MTPPSSPPWTFILDFDGTITTKDTISTIAQFALSSQASRGHDMTKDWDAILGKYGEDYSSHVETYRPLKDERDTLEKEIAFYRSLRGIEIRSFERVSSSGLFNGIQKEDWEQFGREAVKSEEVTVRKGLKEFLERIRILKGRWGIVSVNFSSAFIRGVLEESARGESSGSEVLANQLDERGFLIGPKTQDGSFGQGLATSDAKLAAMERLSHSLSGSLSSKVVYIGDSGTDVECLMEHGVGGVIISEDGKGSLMQSMKRIGVKVIPIWEYEGDESTSIYWARDFKEIVHSPLLS
jgi:2-hydroxy-3-keto-5-methylthiopentenyl-1-phosphate phosphatase